MNKIIIGDTSSSTRRQMVNLLVRAGFEPIEVECIETAKEMVVQLPPGAVIVLAMRLSDGIMYVCFYLCLSALTTDVVPINPCHV